MVEDGNPFRSLWLDRDGRTVRIIDQRWLPHEHWVVGLNTLGEALDAIAERRVRGGPLTAAVCAYGVAFAMGEDPSNTSLMRACGKLGHVSVASVEAGYALREMSRDLLRREPWERRVAAYARAQRLCHVDAENRRKISQHGAEIIADLAAGKPGGRLKVLVLSSAGWLSTVEWGSAFAPVYAARESGIPMHILLDASMGRKANAELIRWELAGQGLSHSMITARSGPEMIQNGLVDLVLLDAQNVSVHGDVRSMEPASRWAEIASGRDVPCYAVASAMAIGWGGRFETGPSAGLPDPIRPDLTVSENLTGLITERGICLPARDAIGALFPDRMDAA